VLFINQCIYLLIVDEVNLLNYILSKGSLAVHSIIFP
jgi:hypothetical protein